MKTLYRLDTSVIGWTDWRERDDTIGTEYSTLEAIQAKALEFEKQSADCDGSYKIVARTIDEETFTVTDTVVKSWSYWYEIGRYKKAEKNIEYYKAEIEKLEAQKERSKSDRRKLSLDGEIEYCKKELAKAEELLKQKK